MEMYVQGLIKVLERLNLLEIKRLISLIEECDMVWVIGNGGSCSSASHWAEDLMKLGDKKAMSIVDMSMMSMVANDYGYENVFIYPLRRLVKKADLVIGLSIGGKSKNILNVMLDKKLECKKFLVTGLRGKGIKVDKLVIPCYDVQICEDVTLTIAHIICRFLKRR